MKKKKSQTPKPNPEDFEEFDPREGFGIFPDDVSLTQNIGCVGGKKPKEKTKNNSSN